MKQNAWQHRVLNHKIIPIEECMELHRVFVHQSAGWYLDNIRQEFQEVSDSASLDAQVLLSHVLDKPRSWILAHPEYILSNQNRILIEISIQRLRNGEPLPYVIGEWEFFGLKLNITPDVLIPRPETELLVETALTWIKSHPGAGSIADVGTGSGCISIALSKNTSKINIVASDISFHALKIAQTNAQNHGVSDRIQFVQSDLLSSVKGYFDVLCANLPYIPSDRLKSLEVFKQEPIIALNGGGDGLKFITEFLQQASLVLTSQGALFMEIDPELSRPAQRLATDIFPHKLVHVHRDYSGLARLLVIRT